MDAESASEKKICNRGEMVDTPGQKFENFCLGGTEGADSTPEKSDKYHAKGVNR